MNCKAPFPRHLTEGAESLIRDKRHQLECRMARERCGEMNSGDILDRLLSEVSWHRDLPQSVSIWIPAPDLCETLVEAVLTGCGCEGEIVFRLEQIEWPAVTRRCGRLDVPMVRATFSAERAQ